MNKEFIPFKRAMAIIALSVGIFLSGIGLALLYYRHIRELYAHNEDYQIAAVVQTSTSKELLKTVYLAELMDLSIDQPVNLYKFSTKEAKRKLLKSPLIKDAKVTRIRPKTIYVDYQIRQPIAFLIDYSNTAVDAEGYLVPFSPFFTPKNLPEVHIGLQSKSLENVWGQAVKDPRLQLAFSLMEYLTKHYCSGETLLRRIDVSHAQSLSCGQREIVIMLEDQVERAAQGKAVLCITPWILRLDVKDYEAGLSRYAVLRQQVLKEMVVAGEGVIRQSPLIVDLRLPHLAFLSVVDKVK